MSAGIIDLLSTLLGGLANDKQLVRYYPPLIFIVNNMAQTKYDNTTLRICQGDTTAFKCRETSTPAFDFTGYSIKATGKYDIGSATNAFQVTLVDGQDGNDFSTGTLVVFLSDEVTAALERSGFWDLQATKDGKVFTLLRGDFELLPDISPAV